MSQVFLNSWYFYNEGSIGFGWMNTYEARNFMEEHEDDTRYEEWFIADLENDTGFDFGNLDYACVGDVLDGLDLLDSMLEWEAKEVVAVGEVYGTHNVQEAIDEKDRYLIYPDTESYYDSCDELVECALAGDRESRQSELEFIGRYFDYDAYHRDCMFDAHEASNGVVLVG